MKLFKFNKHLSFVLVMVITVAITLSTNTTAYASNMVGDMDMSGDLTFDCDSIVDNSAIQPRWLSYPGTRFTMNATPYSNRDMAKDLPLCIGGFVGTSGTKLKNLCRIQLAPAGGGGQDATTVATTWYPHKIAYSANYNQLTGTTLNGYDFFVDNEDTIMRVIEVNGNSNKDIIMSGIVNGNRANWLADDGLIHVVANNYNYVLKIVGIDDEGNTVVLNEQPSISNSQWSIRINAGTGIKKYAVVFGFVARGAGTTADAVSRVSETLAQSVTQTLSDTKSYYNTLLRKVPKPTVWGIKDVATGGITPEQHKLKYYEAWTFVLANYVKNISEDNYDYPQVLCGKPSLWDGGNSACPGTCAWESFIGYQFLAYMLPDEAWKAYEGLMSHVDANGELPGECLPSRKAQTAWYLYSMDNDYTKLEKVYPAIQRYLKWREQNPRWIWEWCNLDGEKDMEFIVSWLRDVDYAIMICDVLGLTEDKIMWENKQKAMITNFRKWFVSPSRIYQYYFTKNNSHYYSYRNEDLPHMICTALDVRNLPDDLVQRFKNYYLSYHNANAPMCGFNKQKHPDSDFVFYGLLENGMYQQFKEYVNINLRECVKADLFAERMIVKNNSCEIEGVMPSLFTACTVITSTFLNNRVRVDSGIPTEIIISNNPSQDINLALNKGVTCTSVENNTSHTANLAVDGIRSTRWASQYSDPQWIQVDLGQEYEINKVVINWEVAYGKSYKIQVSSNGRDYTDVYTTSDSNGGIDTITFSPVSGRYVRMYGMRRATEWGYSVYEFEVYGE